MVRASFLAVICAMAAFGGRANAFHSALPQMGSYAGGSSAFLPKRMPLSGARSLSDRLQRTGICPLMNVDDGSLQPDSAGKVRIGEIPEIQTPLLRRPVLLDSPLRTAPARVMRDAVESSCVSWTVLVARRCLSAAALFTGSSSEKNLAMTQSSWAKSSVSSGSFPVQS